MKGKKKPQRHRDLARIHILAEALSLPRDVYEAVLWTQGRQHSSAKLDEQGRQKVIQHLENLLRQLKPGDPALAAAAGRPHNADTQNRSELKKIEALLTDAGKPWGYAAAIAKRQYRVERLEFCSPAQLASIIAALHRPALKRLSAELEAIFGPVWSHHAGYYAGWLFGFDTLRRDVTKYPEALSQVLRWWQGGLQAVCAWPVDVEQSSCCMGCYQRALRQAGSL